MVELVNIALCCDSYKAGYHSNNITTPWQRCYIMIEKGATYVVMGVLDVSSIAFYVGELIESLGGNVVYTMQNERMKRIFLERNLKKTDPEKLASLTIKYCDVTVEEEVEAVFNEP